MVNRLTTVGLTAAALAMALPSAAQATQFVQYSFSGTVSGIQATQSLTGPGSREQVSGRATFTYVLPSDLPVTSAYFLGGQSSFNTTSSGVRFTETGYDGIGAQGQITALACFGAGGGVNAGCGFSRLLNAWRGGSLDLTGTIDSFTSTVLTGPVSMTGFTGYSLNVAPVTISARAITAVPEPATWAMMAAGFALLGAGLRRRSVATPAIA